MSARWHARAHPQACGAGTRGQHTSEAGVLVWGSQAASRHIQPRGPAGPLPVSCREGSRAGGTGRRNQRQPGRRAARQDTPVPAQPCMSPHVLPSCMRVPLPASHACVTHTVCSYRTPPFWVPGPGRQVGCSGAVARWGLLPREEGHPRPRARVCVQHPLVTHPAPSRGAYTLLSPEPWGWNHSYPLTGLQRAAGPWLLRGWGQVCDGTQPTSTLAGASLALPGCPGQAAGPGGRGELGRREAGRSALCVHFSRAVPGD